jgi:hypothetical protein
MAIGDVGASGGIKRQAVSGRAGQVQGAAFGAVGQALGDLAQSYYANETSKQSMEKYWDSREFASKSLAADEAFLSHENEKAVAFEQFQRDYSDNPIGMTEAYDKYLEETDKKFLASVDKNDNRLHEEYASKLGVSRSNRRASAFLKQVELMDVKDKTTLNNTLNTLGTALKGGKLSMEDAEAQWAETVDKSALPPAIKESMKLEGRGTIASLQFGTEIEMGAKGYGTATGFQQGQSKIAMANAAPWQVGLLTAVGAGEGGDSYNVINGGEKFEGYADHPRRVGAGGTSTAAGKYQFIASTWDIAKASYQRRYGVAVPDFSPEWQDRVALHWIEDTYDRYKGSRPSFREVIASGDKNAIAGIRQVVGEPRGGDPKAVEWQGLGVGFYAKTSELADARFVEMITGEKMGTGSATGPNVWTDERFADIGLDKKLTLANEASSAAERYRREQAAQNKAVADSLKDAVQNTMYYASDLGALEQFKNMPGYDASIEQAGREAFTKGQNREASVGEVETMLGSGMTLGPKQMSGLNAMFGEQGVRGIQTGDDSSYARLASIVSQGKLVPSNAKDSLVAAMRNPNTMHKALEFVASLNEGDPTVLQRSGFTDRDIESAIMFSNIAKDHDPNSARMVYETIQKRIEQNLLNPSAARNEALKMYNENVGFGKVLDVFDSFMPMDRPSLVESEGQGLAISAEAQSLFQTGYMLTGTEDGAKKYMDRVLKRNWGPSSIGGSRTLSRHPVENYYPQVEGGVSIYDSALQHQVTAFATRKGLALEEGSAFVTTDRQTEDDIRNGQPPTYPILAKDSLGNVIATGERFGGNYVLEVAQNSQRAYVNAKAAKASVTGAEEVALRAEERAIAAQSLGAANAEELRLEAEAIRAEALRRKDVADREGSGTITSQIENAVKSTVDTVFTNRGPETSRSSVTTRTGQWLM